MSACRYCHRPITWLPRPNGSFYPPFEADAQIEDAEYEVSSATGEFVATLANTEINVKLRRHSCKEYTERHTVQEQIDLQIPALEDAWSKGYEDGKRSVRHRETVVKVQPTHEQTIRQAEKLARKCVTCEVRPFHWCHYIKLGDDGMWVETKQLHRDR